MYLWGYTDGQTLSRLERTQLAAQSLPLPRYLHSCSLSQYTSLHGYQHVPVVASYGELIICVVPQEQLFQSDRCKFHRKHALNIWCTLVNDALSSARHQSKTIVEAKHPGGNKSSVFTEAKMEDQRLLMDVIPVYAPLTSDSSWSNSP